jgi:hypothetical protein
VDLQAVLGGERVELQLRVLVRGRHPSRKENRSRSARDGTPSKRPYPATCASVRNSIGMARGP